MVIELLELEEDLNLILQAVEIPQKHKQEDLEQDLTILFLDPLLFKELVVEMMMVFKA